MGDLNIKGISVNERVPMAVQNSRKYTDKMYYYSNGQYGYISKKEYNYQNSKIKYTAKCVFLKKEWDKKTEKLLTLKETYDNFVRMADNLKKITDGKINLYKTGQKLVKAALKLFKDLEPELKAEPIEKDEEEFIVNTKRGALAWGVKYKGEAYKYDIVSRYPSIMISNHFSLPIKRGEFKIITKKEFKELKYYPFGIWRVKINPNISGKGIDSKLFVLNDKNYYTHYDLTRAKELDYKMEIIEDGKPNFLYYSASCRIQGNKVFKKFVDFLFDLKMKDVEGAKMILNNLHGGLCKKNIVSRTYNISDGFDIEKCPKEWEVLNATIEGDKHKIKIIEGGYFEFNYARLGPFLTAFGRKAISTMIEPDLKYIKRIHTDGWISSKKIEYSKDKYRSVCNIKPGSYLGELRYEGYCSNIEIGNINDVEGEFII